MRAREVTRLRPKAALSSRTVPGSQIRATVAHVVASPPVPWHDVEHLRVRAVGPRAARWRLRRVGRKVGQELPDQRERGRVVSSHCVSQSGDLRVHVRAAECLAGHLFPGGDLDDPRRGDRQARAGHLDGEVGQAGQQRGGTERVADDRQRDRDLAAAPGEVQVAGHPADPADRGCRDPAAAALTEVDQGNRQPLSLLEQLVDLRVADHRTGGAQHSHVVPDHRDRAAVDPAVPADLAVAGQPLAGPAFRPGKSADLVEGPGSRSSSIRSRRSARRGPGPRRHGPGPPAQCALASAGHGRGRVPRPSPLRPSSGWLSQPESGCRPA